MSRCDETRFHDGHRHTMEMSRICTGMTSCGTQVHHEHIVVAEQEVWCPGICGCGDPYRSSLHGPGEHK